MKKLMIVAVASMFAVSSVYAVEGAAKPAKAKTEKAKKPVAKADTKEAPKAK
jgi:hypothetical protein